MLLPCDPLYLQASNGEWNPSYPLNLRLTVLPPTREDSPLLKCSCNWVGPNQISPYLNWNLQYIDQVSSQQYFFFFY